MSLFRTCLFLCLFAVTACQTAPKRVSPPSLSTPAPVISSTTVVLIPVPSPSILEDDGDLAALAHAIEQSLRYVRSSPTQSTVTFGKERLPIAEEQAVLEHLAQLLESAHNDPHAFMESVYHDFDFYQSAGTDSDRTVTFSSYYEPTIPARKHPQGEFRYPIYARPPDLLDVDLGLFNPAYVGVRLAGRRERNRLVPYYTRRDIDSDGVLSGKGLELAWAKDPVDVLNLHIEGSGWLDVGEKEPVRIRFGGTNGRPYSSVGLHLIATGRVPKDQMNAVEFKRYLNAHPADRQELLNVDERYTFFQLDNSSTRTEAFGNIEVPLTPSRSIATDPKLFPKGGIAWIDTTQPIFDLTGHKIGEKPLRRLVLNQDEGGAIQGPGRVDFFVGGGPDAERFARSFWQKGKLYFLRMKSK